MVISASRRTDLPAFYPEWLINRFRAGFCLIQNPFNARQVSRVSLRPEDVECTVFWTRRSRMLLPFLKELDGMGHRYYFQFTLNAYGQELEPHNPSPSVASEDLAALADRIGPDRVVWRYDPIVFTRRMDPMWHADHFSMLLETHKNHCRRIVISLVDDYRGAKSRLRRLEEDIGPCTKPSPDDPKVMLMLREMATAAQREGLDIFSCAEPASLSDFGIKKGKCIDENIIREVTGLTVDSRKDRFQREACGCIASKDIGMYDTCLHGCEYCYATRSHLAGTKGHALHDPTSPSLMGWLVEPAEKEIQDTLF